MRVYYVQYVWRAPKVPGDCRQNHRPLWLASYIPCASQAKRNTSHVLPAQELLTDIAQKIIGMTIIYKGFYIQNFNFKCSPFIYNLQLQIPTFLLPEQPKIYFKESSLTLKCHYVQNFWQTPLSCHFPKFPYIKNFFSFYFLTLGINSDDFPEFS